MTATPAGHEHSAARLVRRYRRLLWWVALPVFLLLVVLAGWQAYSGWQSALRGLEQAIVRPHSELLGLLRAVEDHLQDMRRQVASDLLLPAREPDVALREAVQPWRELQPVQGWTLDGLPELLRPGLAQLVRPGAGRLPDSALWRLQTLSQLAEAAHARRPELRASYQMLWPERQLLRYPWVPSGALLPAAEGAALAGPLDARFRDPLYAAGQPQANPGTAPYWLAGRDDDARAVVSHAAPVYVGEDFRGIVGTDLDQAALRRSLAALDASGRHWWLVTEDGRSVVAASAADGAPTPSRDDVAQALAAAGRALARQGRWLVAQPLGVAPWVLVVGAEGEALRAELWPALLPFVLLGLALLAMFLYGQQLLRRRVIEPALQVMGYLQARSVDERAPAPRLSERWQPWVGVVTDTFEARRRSAESERRSEAYKTAVVEQAMAAIVTVDASLRIVDWNAAAEAMFGLDRARAIGRQASDFIVRAPAGEGRDATLESIAGKRLELQVRRADGSAFPVEMQVNRVAIDGVAHYSAFIVDISARVQAAELIERQREALRQSEKLSAMGGLLAGVAHELNNPLAIVLGRASLLEAKAEGSDVADDARRIREAAERCGRIVRSFLNMARSRPAAQRPVGVNDLARAATDLLAYTLRTAGITVELRLAESLPEVMADEDRIGQVLMNLLVNAQQALAGCPPPRRLRLETGVSEPTGARPLQVWLRVADSGPGVPASDGERIFTPYYTTKGEGAGVGLGLAVARSAAREHGGDLLLEADSPLAGASFLLTLPFHEAAGRPADEPGEGAPAEEAGGRVLVVDDEAEFAAMVRDALEQAGHEVASAESGAVALQMLDEARFDAVVCDLRMPDMDGVALWREVAARQPALAGRMVFVSGDTLASDLRAMLDRAGCRWLDKPFAPAELLRVVREIGASPPA